ncbi:hypothetical protein IEU95_09920 [Hoyosella rhizosphaerae]|uniref:Uncharacterized protein n=1 Tax=Hoyosella rhizosphaerae TaxID=1755582 RepID=A0A916TZ74_9ACTN|nr:hypothetical protein [Hoyosella rhizosphaerae]MBN4927150.1 hypothetical protein [Hoyosella rhizosphaerae]GGC53593.1 hypothetical protein GCM10011410_02470 [Hoyosella rhizosphaerae]
MSTPAVVLLRYAEQIVDGDANADNIQSVRGAAFLARQALEELVTDQCQNFNSELGRASMRSKLIVLRQLGDSDHAEAASLAWHGLSNACHHHAYELAPTVDEVRHLCAMVAGLLK